MEEAPGVAVQEDWSVLTRLLPEGWQAQARELGALRRARKFDSAATLLRVLLIHLVDGCSLRETAVRAQQGGLARVSDVALLKRLKNCADWFRWMSGELMRAYVSGPPQPLFGPGRRVRVIDGSVVNEPGATGSTWRVHYSTLLPSLACDEVHVTAVAVGESFKRFRVRPGDVLIGDRGLAQRAGIRHVVAARADVLVRLNLTNVPLLDPAGAPWAILPHVRRLRPGQVGDWPVGVRERGRPIAGRLCAIRKSAHAAERARHKAQRTSRDHGHQVQPETLEAAGFVMVFTTLPPSVPAAQVLELYRGRWQVELAFKRLKSLIGLGHLKKTDPVGARAWLQGKLLVAFLIEALIAAGERFFPWGYPLEPSSAA